RGVPTCLSRLSPATVQLSEQLARQSDSISAIDALDRIAQSQDLGGVPGAWRPPPKTDDQDRRSRQTIKTDDQDRRSRQTIKTDDQDRRLGRSSPGWERLLASRVARSPMRTRSRVARGVLLRAELV